LVAGKSQGREPLVAPAGATVAFAQISVASGLTEAQKDDQGLTPAALDDRRSAANGAAPTSRPLEIVRNHLATGPQPLATASWPEAIWLLGVLVVAGRAGWARLLLARFRRRCRPLCDPAVLGCVQRLAGRLGVRRPIRVLLAEGLLAPVVFGSLRPAIAVPARFRRDFDPGQQEAVLAHEMAHLAGWDPVWQFLAGLACVLLWWQPLAWWSRRRLRASSEAVADEASLLVPDGPGLLAASLVAVGRRLLRSQRLGWISIEGDGFRSGLGRRVERLMELRSLGCGPGRVSGRGRGVFAKTLLTVAAALVAISCTAWAQPQAPSLDEGGTMMSVLKTSWRYSLAATALWALVGPSSGTAADNPPSPPEKPKVERPAPPPSPERREGTRRDDSRAPSDEVQKQRQRIMDEIRALQAKVEGRDVSDADRKELRAKMQKLYEQIRELPGGPERVRGEARAPSDEVQKQRQRIMDEIRALRTKAEGLRDGSDADRKELRAKMQKLYEQLQALPGGARPGGPGRAEGREGGPRPDTAGRPEVRGDLERQVQHLRAAVENLRAAGLMDEADMVQRRVQRLTAAASQSGPSREAGPPREGTRPGRDMPGGPSREAGPPREGTRPGRDVAGGPPREGMGPGRGEGPPPAFRGEIAELRGQVQQMRQDMQELREQLRRFMEKQSGDRRPDRAPPPSPGDSGRR
jgi:hypothetical protein